MVLNILLNALAAVMLMISSAASAAELKLDFSIADQHDQVSQISKDIKLIIFTADMEGYTLVREVFEENKISNLKEKKIFFISDISKMPALISKMFAIPKMKELNFQIHLDKEGVLTKDFPRKEKKLTLLKLVDGKVSTENFVDKKEDLLKEITAIQ